MQLHAAPLVGAHLGIDKTLERLRKRVYWVGMAADARQVVRECEVCQRRKENVQQVFHEPMTIPTELTRPNQQWFIDILGPLPVTSRGFRYVLVVVDGFTKFVTVSPLKDIQARTVAEALVNDAIMTHSVPEAITSDNAAQFTSELFSELCKLLGTNHIRASPYHPQANGRVERVNKPLVDVICSVATDAEHDWDLFVKTAAFALNCSVHATTGESAFFLSLVARLGLPLMLSGTCLRETISRLRL
ncbi:hypothetical protein L596_006221 [Steinernema carpocapsae]|uniref:RNA-directed DNA polymerase n=1 Tax=Steinernema carpocapsae TaxID=34508 RepID=A0A4U8V1F6_STECR|nr:hypothetical protein L596_006221 [Steinernema carpocapsae]